MYMVIYNIKSRGFNCNKSNPTTTTTQTTMTTTTNSSVMFYATPTLVFHKLLIKFNSYLNIKKI